MKGSDAVQIVPPRKRNLDKSDGFMTVNDPIEVAGRQKIQPQCAIVALRDAGEIA